MAGIDKMNEFYTCLERFAFLSEFYAPTDQEIDPYIVGAFSEIQKYANRESIKKRIEQAKEYFESFNENAEKFRMQEMMDYLVKKYVRQE